MLWYGFLRIEVHKLRRDMNLKIENVMELNEFFSDIEVRNGEDS